MGFLLLLSEIRSLSSIWIYSWRKMAIFRFCRDSVQNSNTWYAIQGLYSFQRHRLTCIGIPIITLRRSDHRLRYIHVTWNLYTNKAVSSQWIEAQIYTLVCGSLFCSAYIMRWHKLHASWHKHFPRYWPFVRGILQPPVDSPHKRQATLSFPPFRNGICKMDLLVPKDCNLIQISLKCITSMPSNIKSAQIQATDPHWTADQPFSESMID